MPTSKKTTVPAKRATNAKNPVKPTPKPTSDTPATSSTPTTAPTAALTVRSLLSAGTGANIADLAEKAGLSRTTVSKTLSALEGEGAARRENGGREGAHRAPDRWFATRHTDDAAPASPDPEPEALSPAPAPTVGHDLAPEPVEEATAEPGDPAIAQPSSASGEPGTSSSEDTPAEPEPAPVGQPATSPDRQPVAPAAARPAKPAKKSPATPVAPAAQPTGEERRLPKGALRTMVADHLAGNPDLVITASKLGKVLDRSSGAVANALDKLIEQGAVEQVGTKPRTFRHLGAPTSA
jgi:predicted transcriptional regulator